MEIEAQPCPCGLDGRIWYFEPPTLCGLLRLGKRKLCGQEVLDMHESSVIQAHASANRGCVIN
jgi:hypothetical protein